ncbi:MAG: hypothetical protein ACRC8C_03170 [Mycoplasmoidaceae bacterium]
MKEINKDIIDNEEITNNFESNGLVDINSDQIITLENTDNEIHNEIEEIDESEVVEINNIDENSNIASSNFEPIDEMENRLETIEKSNDNNSLETTQVENASDLSFMADIKYPVKHADDEYALKNVLPKLNNGELEYMTEVKKQMYNRKELIHIYPRMFFWKKWKARKINAEIIMEQEAEFQNNYQNILAMRSEYKAKFNEYEHKQRKYKESLFKL